MAQSNKYVCIHGHFYQPPRENPWLEVIEEQEGARPYHDWNARINFECYAPNAAARILDEQGWITKIRNNYNRISFNFGPTLLTWLEQEDPDAYELIQKADKRSMERFGGHGSALAQVYSHLIMPLANYRDKVTQVYWGIRDFEYRFGRKPAGMWLAETAVNTETLEVLAAQDIQFTVLAPRQARAIRPVGADTWRSVSVETLDTRRAYKCVLPSGREIALFFYHGGLAQKVAFEGILNNGQAYAQDILRSFDDADEPQLVHVATDGESYGHHHRFGEMALAACLNFIEDSGKAKLTNYGQFLELHPPTYEVQIHEDTSWSCAHGVERWRGDCGCNTGGHHGWHQRWRKPLRVALDWLRDSLAPLYEKEATRLLRDPWAARNDYVDVILQRDERSIQTFFEKHTRRKLSALEEVAALRLLEMQRQAVLMYTSCGWFFDEISGIETQQILQYALRAIDYANDVVGVDLQKEFMRRLEAAPSNKYAHGAAVYQQEVLPRRVNLERVAMHFAVASLFEEDPAKLDLLNYTAGIDSFEKIEAGTPILAIGRIAIRSRLTRAEKTFCFAILYLGQQHIIGNISADMNRSTFDEMRQRTAETFRAANIGDVIGAFQQYFGPDKFTLASLLADEKAKIIRAITASSLAVAESTFRDVFNDNYQLMIALQNADLPVPNTWTNIASYVLNADLLLFFHNSNTPDTRTLRRIADDIQRWNIKLTDEEAVRHAIGERLLREMAKIENNETSLARLRWLTAVIEIVFEINLRPRIWRVQNMFYLVTKGYRKEEWVFLNDEWRRLFERLAELLKVRLRLL